VAEPVRVAKNGNLGRVLYIADELVGAAGNNEVDVAVLGKELGDDIARCDELDG
jgi:hypothetical protein